MGVRTLGRLLAIMLACSALAAPAGADDGQSARGRARKAVPGLAAAEDAGPRAREGRSLAQRPSRPYQEPAFAAGYESGYEKGFADGRDGERYDPVRHADYRDAESGYTKAYGPRDAYRNNYRAGFRQGYEAGYRDGARSR